MAEQIVFPNKIRLLRRQQNRKMQDLADYVGLSLSALSKIEKGFRRLNHQQSMKVADFIGVDVEDLFLTEKDADSAITKVWQDVVSERIKKNQNSGLKILSSGLRFLRMQKNMTLGELAEKARITVSVYHRIEHGERPIYEKELVSVSKILGIPPHKLLEEIFHLYKAGVLDNFEFKAQKNKEKPVVSMDKNSLLHLSKSLYGEKLYKNSRQKLLPLLGNVKKDYGTEINKKSDDVVEAPFVIVNPEDFFAFYADSKSLKNIFPRDAVFFAQKVNHFENGDIVLFLDKDFDAGDVLNGRLMNVKEDLDGNSYIVSWNLEEKALLESKMYGRLRKICFIDMRK
ncbi:MAG: helix-turn-helix transcriptional regulator [Rickettsiales bacterium]|jgi:transcriptional regulator with XRE-family HTH domain|nr:helix-turn-helix transcriptional regulator [Rickettsiales bacterium]